MNIQEQLDSIQQRLDTMLEDIQQEIDRLRNQTNASIYPLYMKLNNTGDIVKFTSLRSGTVVSEGSRSEFVLGYWSHDWRSHKDPKYWTPVVYDEERGIFDKQLCECWNKEDTHQRFLQFYDAINKGAYMYNGNRNDGNYDRYKPIPRNEYPQWAIDAEKTLEG
jgi:hypothetical protein